MEMDGGNKEDYGRCQEIFFSHVLARPKYFQPLRRNIQKAELFAKYVFPHLLIFSLLHHTVKLLVFSKKNFQLHSSIQPHSSIKRPFQQK